MLAAAERHEILLLSRKVRVLPTCSLAESLTCAGFQDAPAEKLAPGVTWVKTNYEDPKQLDEIMRGVHTVLSFITAHMDPGSVAQKGLIDAAVRAGVKRFAPSEWAMYVVIMINTISYSAC